MNNPTEKEFLNHFLKIYDLKKKPLNIKKVDPPDFLLYFTANTLGIELTELFKNFDPLTQPAPKKAIESGWDATLKETEKIWLLNNHPKIEVDVTFNDRYHINKKNYKTIAQKIVQIVFDNLPNQGNYIYLKSEDFDLEYFPNEISDINISRLVDYDRSYWHYSDGGFVPELSPDQVQEAISKKNLKINDYLDKCDQIWLLIIIHGWRDSSFMQITDDVIKNRYTSLFDKTILFHTLRETIHILNTKTT